jgi:hypothetical protein
VSYRIPLDGDNASVSQTLRYPVDEMNLLVADLENIEAAIDGLDFAQDDIIQGMPYRVWNGTNLAAGTQIAAEISNALAVGDVDPRLFAEEQTEVGVTTAASTSSAAEPLEPMVPLVLGGLLALGLAGVFVWSMRNDRPAHTRQRLAADRDELIGRIADLDDSHARGEIDDATWASERAALKRELLDVANQLRAPQQA